MKILLILAIFTQCLVACSIEPRKDLISGQAQTPCIADIGCFQDYYTLDNIHKNLWDRFQATANAQSDWPTVDQIRKPVVQGDCKTFAFAAWHELQNHHIPARIIIVQLPSGKLHAVTESNGYILDSRQRRVKDFRELENDAYVFKFISSYQNNEEWHLLNNGG